MFRRIIAVIGVIVLPLLLGGCRQTLPSEPSPTASFPTVTLAPGFVSPVARGSSEIPRIAPQEVWQRQEAGERVTIIDTRSAEEYRMEHITGAISLPASEMEQRWSELARDSLLVFYCT